MCGDLTTGVRDEVKSRAELQKDLKKKEKNKIKQMNKHDRKAYMKKQGKGRR